MLCRWGSHVKTAVSIHDLVETLKFKDGKVDMVLMDVNMPDGLDLEEVTMSYQFFIYLTHSS